MKSLLSLLVLMLGLTAQAQVPGYTQVPYERMDDYKRAISQALQDNPNAGNACNPNFTNYAFHMTREIFLSDGNAQPLLLFNSYDGPQDQQMNRLVFFTSPDLKTLTKVYLQVYRYEQTSSGDLSNPVFKYDYVLKNQWDCSRSH